jgi:hypothetical protein
MAKILNQCNFPSYIKGSTVCISLGTDIIELYDELIKCDIYHYQEITYKIIQCSPNDVTELNIDIYITKNRNDLPINNKRVHMWILQSDKTLNNKDNIYYIRSSSDLNTNLTLLLRLDIQRMIIATAFNKYLDSIDDISLSYDDVKIIFINLYANIMTIHQLKIYDLIYKIDFAVLDIIIKECDLWLQKKLNDKSIKEDDSLVKISTAWKDLLTSFPYYKNGVKYKKLEPSENSMYEITDSPVEKFNWEESLRLLFCKRWNGTPPSSQDLRDLNNNFVLLSVKPEAILMMFESISSCSEMFGNAKIIDKYWYFSNLYELIHISIVRVSGHKGFNDKMANAVTAISVQYAAERDNCLYQMIKDNIAPRPPTSKLNMQLENALFVYIFTEMLLIK